MTEKHVLQIDKPKCCLGNKSCRVIYSCVYIYIRGRLSVAGLRAKAGGTGWEH